MESIQGASHPIITQTKNNTTLWIGHLQTDPTDHFAGQTFKCPDEGLIDNADVFAFNIVHYLLSAFFFNTFNPLRLNKDLVCKRCRP